MVVRMNKINNTVNELKSQAYSTILNLCHLICGDNLHWRWSDKNNCYIPNSVSKKEQEKEKLVSSFLTYAPNEHGRKKKHSNYL